MHDIITDLALFSFQKLKELQLEDGGFSSYRSEAKAMQDPEEYFTPFFGAFALDGLVELKSILDEPALQSEIKEIGDRLALLLWSNAEAKGLFRFFGPHTHLPPDTDSTSCVLSALYRYGFVSYVQCKPIIYRISELWDGSDAYQTWFLSETQDGRVKSNDIDIHVNANVAYFLSCLNQNVVSISKYILNNIKDGRICKDDIYYPEDTILLAAFIARTLCFAENAFLGRRELEHALKALENQIMILLWSDKDVESVMHLAAAVLAGIALSSYDYNRRDRWELAAYYGLYKLHATIEKSSLLNSMFPGQPGLYYGAPSATLGMVSLALGAWHRVIRQKGANLRDGLRPALAYQERLRIQEQTLGEAKALDEWLLHYPTNLIVEITNRCNFTCPVCVSGRNDLGRERRDLDPKLYKDLIADIGNNLLSIALFNYGEPFLHPDFIEMIRISKQTDAFVITCTNGMFLNEKNCFGIIDAGLDQIVVSLDGTSDESIRAYRGENASFSTIVQGIKTLVSQKKKLKSQSPKIVLQMIFMKSTQHLCEEFFALAKELEVDEAYIKAVVVDLSDQETAWEILPDEKSQWHRYEIQNGIIEHIGSLPESCVYLYNYLTVLADGRVVPCCYDGRAEVVLGDLSKSSIVEIWNGAIMRDFRRSFQTKARSLPMCSMCPTGKIDSIKVSNSSNNV